MLTQPTIESFLTYEVIAAGFRLYMEVDSSWNVIAHGDARVGKVKGETGEWSG